MERYYGLDDEPIITEDEQKIIVDWTRENYESFSSSGYHRCRQCLDLFKDLPSIFEELRNRIVKKEGLENVRIEPIFRDSIAYMRDGGKLHLHKDPNRDGLIHVRFNVYVQLPYEGGVPIYAKQFCPLNERTYICCRSGLDYHECTMVIGERERVMVSYGFLMKPEEIGKITYNYAPISLFSI